MSMNTDIRFDSKDSFVHEVHQYAASVRFETNCGLIGPIKMKIKLDSIHSDHIDLAELAAKATAEFIGYHSVAIRPHLNGFRGYAGLQFTKEQVYD